jgi:F-type H+-transporting ATPase subunit b
MLIDWFTVAAQLFNFLVLVWLMKRFLYQPILNALDARERKISAELAAADQKKLEAQAEREEFLRKNQEFEQQRIELLKAVNEEAKTERQRLLNEARQEVTQLRSQQQKALKTEQQNLIYAFSRRTQSEVFAIARQALADLAGTSLEDHIVKVFIDKLQQLTDTEIQQMTATVKTSAMPLLIHTAFDLQPVQMDEIEQAVQKIFGINSQLQFKTAPHLISGIELSSDGQKISWTISNYLAGLEKHLNELLHLHVEVTQAAQPDLEPDSIVAEDD